jgi:hypothetical protein
VAPTGPIAAAVTAEVTTSEGLARDGELHPNGPGRPGRGEPARAGRGRTVTGREPYTLDLAIPGLAQKVASPDGGALSTKNY